MKVRVDISIFADPCTAWGQATGEIDVPQAPRKTRDVIKPELPHELLAHPVEVEAVGKEAKGLTFVIFNVIAKDSLAARHVGDWLEREWGLYAEPYGEK